MTIGVESEVHNDCGQATVEVPTNVVIFCIVTTAILPAPTDFHVLQKVRPQPVSGTTASKDDGPNSFVVEERGSSKPGHR